MTITDTAPELDEQPTLDGMPADVPPADEVPKPAPKRRGRPPRSDKAAQSAPAKPSATRTRRAPAKPKVNIAEKIAEMYVIAGGALLMVPSPAAKGVEQQLVAGEDGTPVALPGPSIATQVGMSIMANAVECGKAWEQVAEENPQVAAVIERVLTVSVFGALFAAHLPILLTAGVSAGAVPPIVAQMLSAPAN